MLNHGDWKENMEDDSLQNATWSRELYLDTPPYSSGPNIPAIREPKIPTLPCPPNVRLDNNVKHIIHTAVLMIA